MYSFWFWLMIVYHFYRFSFKQIQQKKNWTRLKSYSTTTGDSKRNSLQTIRRIKADWMICWILMRFQGTRFLFSSNWWQHAITYITRKRDNYPVFNGRSSFDIHTHKHEHERSNLLFHSLRMKACREWSIAVLLRVYRAISLSYACTCIKIYAQT